MFKQANIENEIMQNMAKNLKANSLEEQHNFTQLDKITSLLSIASENFERAGLKAESDALIQVLQSFTRKLKAK
jgi:hypothetical protein